VDYVLVAGDESPIILIARSRKQSDRPSADDLTNRATPAFTQVPVDDVASAPAVVDETNRALVAVLTRERMTHATESIVELPFLDAGGTPVKQIIRSDDNGRLPFPSEQSPTQIDAVPPIADVQQGNEGTYGRGSKKPKRER